MTEADRRLLPLKELANCTLCPRQCGVNRFSTQRGYCNTGAGFNIGAITVHKGEEPVISGTSGICNVFFSRCNLQCIFCQNYQISRNKANIAEEQLSLENVIQKIISILDTGVSTLGFVSPSHCMVQMEIIIRALAEIGRKPVIVMNTNAYDRVETLRRLEGLVDVYLPDFKYMDAHLSKTCSDAPDYPEIAVKAIQEMYRQKGSSLLCNDTEQAEFGLIIRHLVLPGYVENSLAVLRCIAEKISTSVHISLMAQYYPTEPVRHHPMLGRTLTHEEYDRVVSEMEALGFYRGWVQELDSSSDYVPDFMKDEPFE